MVNAPRTFRRAPVDAFPSRLRPFGFRPIGGLAAFVAAGLISLAAGCGPSSGPPDGLGEGRADRRAGSGRPGAGATPEARAPGGPSRHAPPETAESGPSAARPAGGRRESTPAHGPPPEANPSGRSAVDPPSPARLPDLADSASVFLQNLPRLVIDRQRVAELGIRRLAGRRLELYTDLPPSDEVDVLPALFDQAFPQWCEYFRIDARQYDSWQMTGFLMAEKDRFQQAGLLPDELPPFEHGYSRNYELWLYEQASAYYRRHLLLHEGTHGLMNTIFGGCGPPWYMEGIAELLATHRWSDGRLVLNHVPQSRDETPMWGRIGFIQKEFAAGHAVPLEVVIGYGSQAHRQPGPYAWCWALALLLDRHPAYRDHFRRLPAMVTRPDFSERFRQALASAWPELGYQWQILVANLDYGHDVARTVVDFTPGRDLPPGGAQVVVQADRGWQNSGFRLPEGARYQLEAAGRYQIDSQPRIWWCEPNGVSIRYHQGRPLGLLLAAVQPDPPFPGPTPLLNPIPVGLGTTIVPRQSGTLFLRINDSPGDLANNRGTLTVRITAPQ